MDLPLMPRRALALALVVIGAPAHGAAPDRTVDPADVTRRSERVDPGEEVTHFDVGDIDLRLQLAFTGNTLGPQSLITAFFNWFEVQLAADLGVAAFDDFTLGLGLEAFIGRPWIPESVSTLTSAGGADLAWRAASRGALLRASMHYTRLSSFDPYALLLVGPTADTVRAADGPGGTLGRFNSAGLRFGAGAGLNLVSTDRVVGGFELRYLASPRFSRGVGIPLLDAQGAAPDSFDLGRAQRSARGFSWVASIGVRL